VKVGATICHEMTKHNTIGMADLKITFDLLMNMGRYPLTFHLSQLDAIVEPGLIKTQFIVNIYNSSATL
jgi:hypothetical protein